VEVERLTGVLGQVCRACHAYNEPGTRACVSCGAALPAVGLPRGGTLLPSPGAAPAGPFTAAVLDATPGHHDLPPLDLSAPPPLQGLDFEALDLEPLPVDAADGAAPPSAPGADPTVLLLARCPACGADVEGDWCTCCGRALEPGWADSPPPRPTGLHLVLERGDGTEGTAFPLAAAEQSAGRSRGEIRFPGDACLDGLHATFRVEDGSLRVRDEGSSGGTFLRLRGTTASLAPGDLFALGDRLLRFGGPLAPPAPPLPDGTRRLGSPRPTGHAVRVEEILVGGAAGRVWVRGGPSVTLGRAGCAIDLGDDPYLSLAHAEIVVEPDGTARLRDLGSSNGTFVRLPAHAERELREGDVIRMGSEVLRVASNPG
jgi:hypothetical protein